MKRRATKVLKKQSKESLIKELYDQIDQLQNKIRRIWDEVEKETIDKSRLKEILEDSETG